ncbi:hypothetical protein E1B28_001515 [Marasmius oreades]|uniref:Protein kinase domain-containing protein n=1 Tax=Marasmius oreades TaxID=181124 RepID=A0A9P7V3Q9_9AGAR|nr:uncharacterized protein E1B28_001515 [Marasmius oreades]KAG7099693.1 hypothetical protein E1B28_001515 [Marasmius oreades]
MPPHRKGPELELHYSEGNVYYLQGCDSDYPHQHAHAHVVKKFGKNVCQAWIGARNQKPTALVALKIARGSSAVKTLEYEAGIYRGALRDLQGKVVPKYHGLYRTVIDGHTELGVMILEFCSNSKDSQQMEKHEYTRRLMLAACKLHQAGVVHGQLYARHTLEIGQEIRIIDFSRATVSHRCVGAVPMLLQGRGERGCEELVWLEEEYGASENEDVVAEILKQRNRNWINSLPAFLNLELAPGRWY